MIATKETAQNREIEALKNLAYFGFLTTKSIALLTTGAKEPTALKSAKRVINRLIVKKEILRRKSLEGIYCYVLTLAGARRVKPYCFKQRAKTGTALQTRFAIRQDKIIEKIREIQATFEGITLGEVWLKRDSKRYFLGLHGLIWNNDTNTGIGIYYISSIRMETAEHIVKLQNKTKSHIKEIHFVSIDGNAEQAIVKRVKKVKSKLPLPPIDL
jgi:hypothetical protein